MVIAVFGGIGAGKSMVLSILEEEFSMRVCRTDELAKSLYQPGTEVYRGLLALFGREIMEPETGALDRRRMAKQMFSDPALTEQVSRLVHPVVWGVVSERIADARESAYDLAVETALPTEEFLRCCDHRIFVSARRDLRLERLLRDRGYSRAEAEARLHAEEAERFLSFADIIIENSRTKEETINEIYQYFERLQRERELHRDGTDTYSGGCRRHDEGD